MAPCPLPHVAPVQFDTCLFASPLVADSQGQSYVLVVPKEGPVTAVGPEDGQIAFQVDLPTPDGEVASAIATPVLVGRDLFVAYQTAPAGGGDRGSHRVVAIDLEQRALDPRFEPVVLSASKPTWDGMGQVEFRNDRALSRSALAFGRTEARPEGFVYVSFGNSQDIQPWHGWVFELDVESWRTGGAASAESAVLLTSPEDTCPVEGQSGSMDMICGGGVWAPSGPRIVPSSDGATFDLIVPTGNGLLDLTRSHYANSVLRVGPGLAFDPRCDPVACADFDPIAPAEACMESCENLFMPRLRPGDAAIEPSSGKCDGLTLLQCYAALDYDLGANTPALAEVGGQRLWVLPGKDGAVYLFDAERMGVLYDREVVVDQCGAPGDTCAAEWAGMMVTEPRIVTVDGEVIALVSTFIFDHTHPAGVVALTVTNGPGGPALEPRWQAPSFDSELARELFRRHSSRIAVFQSGSEAYAAVVSVVRAGSGTLLVVRVRDGEIVSRTPLSGQGRRFIEPLVSDGVLWTTSCDDNAGPGLLESFRLFRE